MEYERFLAVVDAAGGLGRDGAERATTATLQTLAERVSSQKARELASALPPQLGPLVTTEAPPERFDVDDFLRRVAEREGTAPEPAERDAEAVFTALAQALGDREFANLVAQLPKDYAYLLPGGPPVVPAEELVAKVSERTGLDDQAARRSIDAVLETLAERVSVGEANHLVGRLPVPLHEPLRRGLRHNPGPGRRMSLAELLALIAERDDAPPDRALEHARAVFMVVREAVGEEFFDCGVHLPPDHTVLWARTAPT
ncbi:DUF2267 domain-containing protein [Actinopolymorpha singaporensis]|uniref:Uncharacterized conserved protein, DUF2267 family n=1 Tax=Actinopolymorpha singaporensis TaxID=117157 RepID=A0A1H1WIW2_9ACTN|nr:DUF2267 domain-containing protein [Actinopolymorpha singaporensis]SDS96932.1 Uncharacterized conserved protein, DUF2267 family [Actinopolymorpha singaporensis]